MIELTEADREKFMLWLVQESKSAEDMSELLSTTSFGKMMVKKKKQEAAACKIVAHLLGTIEPMTLGV